MLDPASGPNEDRILQIESLRVLSGASVTGDLALDGVDLPVARGAVTVLVGRRASGKTVALQAIAGMLPPPGRIIHGAIRLRPAEGEAVDVATLAPESPAMDRLRGGAIALVERTRAGGLDPLLPIGRQVRPPEINDASLWRPSARLLGLEDLDGPLGACYPHHIAPDVGRRIALHGALVARPELLLLDDPLAGADGAERERFVRWATFVRDAGGPALLIAARNPAPFMGLANRLAILWRGRVVEVGPTGEVRRQPAHPFTAALLERLPDRFAPGHIRPNAGAGPAAGAMDIHGCPWHPWCDRRIPGFCDVGLPPPGLFHVADLRWSACLRVREGCSENADRMAQKGEAL